MIYLDHNSTTPLNDRVFDRMVPYLRDNFGNPSSYYQLARDARAAVEEARQTVAAQIGARPEEVVFTAGGTEADNLALRGVAVARRDEGRHLITTTIEHHAVLRTCESLQAEGWQISYLPVDGEGRVDPHTLRRSIRPDTTLISVMGANNETGVIQPLAEIAAVARDAGVVFHSDAVQLLGKTPLDVDTLGVDLMSLSAHKVYGPKGVGVLYVRQGAPMASVMTGGHHEHGRRAGTENVAGIVGMAAAVSLVAGDLGAGARRLESLRDRLENRVCERIDGVTVNGRGAPRVAGTTSLSFKAVDGESILLHLDLHGICASTGSACTTDSPEPSHVLLAMGVEPRDAQGTVRFSLGKDTDQRDIDTTVDRLVEIIGQLRAISSV